jgi:hypothetical protein
MTPQHSYPPGRSFHWGMTAQAYECMECYYVHIHALYSNLYNVTLRSAIPTTAVASRFVRYCFYCFPKWLIYLGQHLAWAFISCRWQQLAHATARHLLDPPEDPPWYKFTNYLNAKNRPFFNPSSWTVPVTWRSLERN